PDHLVVVEAHPAAGFQTAGGGFADVVQQCGQPQHQVRSGDGPVRIGLQIHGLVQHGEGVLVDVLVPVVFVDGQLQCGQFRQYVVGQPGVHQYLQAAAGGAG